MWGCGDCKVIKCSWYLLSYKFIKGEARLRCRRELPQYEMVIPQPNAPDQVIDLVDVGEAKKTLGVFTAPLSDLKRLPIKDKRTAQLKYMVEKGEKWGSRVASSKLSEADRWLSFNQSTKPSMSYGIVPLMDSPQRVIKAFNAMYFKILSSLGVNQHITRGWRT